MRKDIESPSGRGSPAILILAAVAVVFFVYTLSRWGRFVKGTIVSVVERLASQSGISTNLLYGIVIIGTIPFFWAVARYMHGGWLYLWHLGPGLRLYKSVHGMIIVAYVGLYFLAMFYVARNSIAYKYCAQTPEGLKVFDDPIKDPVWGIQSQPCNTQQIADYERAKHAGGAPIGPQRVQVTDARTFPFFDNVTHNSRYWYSRAETGDYKVFDLAGYDPETSVPLRPIDQQVRDDMIRLQDHRAAAQRDREEEALVGKYVNTGALQRNGARQAAILVFSDNQIQLADIDQTISHALSDRGIVPNTSFFKPAFVQEGRAAHLFEGDWSEGTQLGLGGRVAVIILGHASVTASESSQFEGLISTRLNLDLKCLNSGRRTSCGNRSVDSVGAGYSNDESLRNAIDKARPDLDAFVKALTLN